MASHSPHVVILPFPTQGHIKPMLMLAELLSQAGVGRGIAHLTLSHFPLFSCLPLECLGVQPPPFTPTLLCLLPF
ncbi:hypothetical protein ACS0TY_015600 [Phlomoides rotata]